MGQAIADRIENLLAALMPQDLESRLRHLVTEVRWNDPQSDEDNPGAHMQRQGDQVRALAKGTGGSTYGPGRFAISPQQWSPSNGVRLRIISC